MKREHDRSRLGTGASVLGLGLLGALATWVAATAGTEVPQTTRRLALLEDAAAKGRRFGKPLLVLLVPAHDPELAAGRWFGNWLDSEDSTIQLELALVEFASASREELSAWLGVRSSALPGDPLGMVLVDVSRGREGEQGPPFVALDVRSPTFAAGWIHDVWPDPEATWARAERGMRELTALVRNGLQQLSFDDERLADEAERRMSATDRRAIELWLRDGGMLEQDLALRAAASVHRRLEAMPSAVRNVRARQLAASMNRTWGFRQVVAGAQLKLDEALCLGCGMGRVPALGGSFLDLYTAPPGSAAR